MKEVIQHGGAHRSRSSQSDQRRCVEYDEHGGLVGQAAFPADGGGIRELERWAKRFGQRRWAIEGASGIGRPLAQKLAASGEEVVDVPPKLSAKVRVLSTGNARKNDRLDATFTALAALRDEQLARVHPEDGLEGRVEILRLLTERRDDLVAERTRTLKAACTYYCVTSSPMVLCCQRSLGGGCRKASAPRSSVPCSAGRTRKWLASELVRDVRALDRKVASLDERIREEVEASGTTLTELFGIGPILAAKIVGIVGDVGRFPNKEHFASYAGVAPIEVSSGEVVKHRVSLAGNRRLNQVMHMIAVCQARSDPRGKAYYRKKLEEGKSRREAMRCLKRRISDAVFKALAADSRRASLTVA